MTKLGIYTYSKYQLYNLEATTELKLPEEVTNEVRVKEFSIWNLGSVYSYLHLSSIEYK